MATSIRLAIRFGGLGYSCDINGLPEASVEAFSGLDVWIVDALRYAPHPSHFCVDDALALDRAAEAETRDPDQPAFRPGL